MARKTREYRVVWVIELDAAGPKDAAKEAQAYMRDKFTNWTFKV